MTRLAPLLAVALLVSCRTVPPELSEVREGVAAVSESLEIVETAYNTYTQAIAASIPPGVGKPEERAVRTAMARSTRLVADLQAITEEQARKVELLKKEKSRASLQRNWLAALAALEAVLLVLVIRRA